MKFEDALLEQDRGEVQAAMQEEGCAQCFGCPHATVEAANIVLYSNALFNMLNRKGIVSTVVRESLDSRREEAYSELANLTDGCQGFSEDRRQAGRPAMMCDSPSSPDSRLQVAAGRFLEVLGLSKLT